MLISAYSRFGSRWPVISRYYQLRTPEFLEAEYNQHERLLRRRTKENILTPYPSLKELIEEGVAQIKKKNKVEVEIDEEKDIEESKKSDTESVQEMEQEPRYKIINHLTFMVEEI